MTADGFAPIEGCGDAECTLMAKEVGVKDKTGTLFSTTSHILTAMVGAGVLAMPLSLGNLGWVAGPIAIILFYLVSVLAARLLASVYEVDGVQHPRYFEAVRHILGRRAEIAAAVCQLSNMFLVCIAYIITASISMATLANLACGLPPEQETTSSDGCFNSQWAMSAIFGGVQVFFSQLPNIEESSWVSLIGALTAITYSTIALGLSIAKVASGNHYGTVGGIEYDTVNKVFAVLNSLGSIGFAYSFSQILLEIQDTIREPPVSQFTMKRAAGMGLTIGASFYLAIAVFGYLAFGSALPDDILTAFDSPKWLIMLAHVLVILHMVAAYNVFAQTIFLTLEGAMARMMGVRHPAEEAALKAAAAVLAAAGEPEGVEKGAGKSFSEGAEAGSPAAAGTGSAAPAAPGRQAAQLPKAALSARALRLRPRASMSTAGSELYTLQSAELASRGSAPVHSLQPAAAEAVQRSAQSEATHLRLTGVQSKVLALRNPSVIHCIAAVDEGRVMSIAGPYRMQAPCRPFAVHPGEPGPSSRPWRLVVFSVAVRALYVVVTTVVAVVMPFFSQITGLIGSLTFFPLTIYFPFVMYMRVYRPSRGRCTALYTLMAFMFAIAAGATVAAVRNIINEWGSFSFV